MITLWGVYSRSLGDFIPGYVTTDEREAQNKDLRWGIGDGNYSAKLIGDFVQVTPEVVEAVHAIRGQITSTLCPHELAILNWAAQAVGESRNET